MDEDVDEKEKKSLELWKLFSEYNSLEFPKIDCIESYLELHVDDIEVYLEISFLFRWQKYYKKCEDILDKAISHFGENEKIIVAYGEMLNSKSGENVAIEYFKQHNDISNPEVVIKLVELLIEINNIEEARVTIHPCYLEYPQSEQLRSLYAKVCSKLNEYEMVLYFYDSLTKDYPSKTSYWVLLSNAALSLDKYDLAYSSCLKANELAEGKEAWIHANLGNMLKNKGFYSEAIKNLKVAEVIHGNSEYTLDRLSKSMKAKEKEQAEVDEMILVGKTKVWNE